MTITNERLESPEGPAPSKLGAAMGSCRPQVWACQVICPFQEAGLSPSEQRDPRRSPVTSSFTDLKPVILGVFSQGSPSAPVTIPQLERREGLQRGQRDQRIPSAGEFCHPDPHNGGRPHPAWSKLPGKVEEQEDKQETNSQNVKNTGPPFTHLNCCVPGVCPHDVYSLNGNTDEHTGRSGFQVKGREVRYKPGPSYNRQSLGDWTK